MDVAFLIPGFAMVITIVAILATSKTAYVILLGLSQAPARGKRRCLGALINSNNASNYRLAHKTCPPGQFLCETTNQCIEGKWFCDGEPDCKDHSDERHPNCTKQILQSDYKSIKNSCITSAEKYP
uniref:Vitellogenin receptor n=1 Tax=Romanomermis culicivorax TaxID=13658 RepID=A0A915KEP0_ROMCU